MTKVYFSLVIIGTLLIIAFALADFFTPAEFNGIDPAQLLGILIGGLLVITGVGFLTVDRTDRVLTRKPPERLVNRILDLSPSFWVVSTFLLLYMRLFISHLFFEKQKIQYFVKYIPYEWVTRVGYDIVWTVDGIKNWFLDRQSPYNLYSPLTTVLFSPLVLIGYPEYYKLIVIITLLFFTVATLLVPILVRSHGNAAIILLLFMTGLLSYGFQFELDRGQFNLIAFGASILAIYIFHFQSKYRFFAYVLFSVSIQLKIYPAIFILMFIDNWRSWKDNLRRITGLGVFNFLLLFVLGYKPFIEFIQNMADLQLKFASSRHEDLSIKGFVNNLTSDGFGLIPPGALSNLRQLSPQIELVFFLVFGLCLLSIILYAYMKNQEGLNPYLLVACTIGALIIPSMSYDYKLPMLIAPISITLSNLPSIDGKYKKSIATILIIIMSIAFWSTYYPFTIKPYLFSRNFLALMMILISITALNLLIPYSIIGHKRDSPGAG